MTTPPALLQLDADGRVLLSAEGRAVPLQVSPRSITAHHWPHGTPGLLPLELAIDAVENAIEQTGLAHRDRGVLRLSAGWRELLPPPWSGPGTTSRDAVEAAFSRLVATSGAAGGHAEPQHGGEAAAALLMVRELMHHLGFHTLGTDG